MCGTRWSSNGPVDPKRRSADRPEGPSALPRRNIHPADPGVKRTRKKGVRRPNPIGPCVTRRPSRMTTSPPFPPPRRGHDSRRRPSCPRVTGDRRNCLSQRMHLGPRPSAGSSNSNNRGSPSSVEARPSRCLMPDEKPPTARSASRVRSTRSSISTTLSAGRPAVLARSRRWFRALRPG